MRKLHLGWIMAIGLALLAPGCTGAPGLCGDGVLDVGETCDGTAVADGAHRCEQWVCDDCDWATECWALVPCVECQVVPEACPTDGVLCITVEEWEATWK